MVHRSSLLSTVSVPQDSPRPRGREGGVGSWQQEWNPGLLSSTHTLPLGVFTNSAHTNPSVWLCSHKTREAQLPRHRCGCAQRHAANKQWLSRWKDGQGHGKMAHLRKTGTWSSSLCYTHTVISKTYKGNWIKGVFQLLSTVISLTLVYHIFFQQKNFPVTF